MHGWSIEALSEGEAFLRTQKGFGAIPVMMDYIMGDYSRDMTPGAFSKITDNRFGLIALNFAAAMTDIKPFWTYHTFNQKYESHAQMGGKITKHWWTGRLIDLKFMGCIQYASVAGSGYPHLVYSEQMGDLDCIPEDPRDVLPFRPANNISIQDCFGVIIRRERTVNYLKQKYPQHAALIKPDRDLSAATVMADRAAGLLNRVGLTSGFMENFWASLGGRPKAHMAIPAADTFTLYLKDDRRNTTGARVWVGEGSPDEGKHPNWSYWCEPGDMIYPRGRTIIFTRTVVLRDGPSIYWHGLFPLPKITLDPWPWSWLGKPPLLDLIGPQEELNKLYRGTADHNQKAFRQDIVADKNAVSRAAMDKIDSRRAGLKLRYNPTAGTSKGVEFVPTQALDSSVAASIMDLRDEMDRLSGIRDLQQLMNLGQIPATETIEKILETMSPAIRLRSRTLEGSLREFAMMTLSNVFQFYSLDQRMAILGPMGMTFEDFDNDPGTMVPAFLSKEDEEKGIVKPQHIRAKEFLRQFIYDIAPGSLLSASEVTDKLLYIQLMRAGLMDVWTLFEKLGIPNAGAPPDPNATTITQRLLLQNQIGLTPQVSATGRKASGQTEPQMKSSGQITESK